MLFSLWDYQIAQTVGCGEGVACTNFKGKVTGRKSYFDITTGEFPWDS
jgi:hypothetical protein